MEDDDYTLQIVKPMIIKPKILYIIPYRGKNLYRKKNLKIVLEWISLVREYLRDNYDIPLDIYVVEQDKEPNEHGPHDGYNYKFLNNSGTFNKGWCFNVIVKENPDYDYYCFGDADIVCPDIETFCEVIIDHTIVFPKPAFRPFTDRLDTLNNDRQLFSSFCDLIKIYTSIKTKLQKHGGLSFASNMIFLSKQTFDTIGGWDEIFKGWGRYDDFITFKLSAICGCNNMLSSDVAVHLWHPTTIDYSLNAENVYLYDKYIKLNRDDLIKMVENNYKTAGNPDLYINL